MRKTKTHVTCSPGMTHRKPVERVVARLLTRIFENQPGPFLVAVGGPGGTGKSTFSRNLAGCLAESTVVRLDDYKTARRIRRNQNVYGAHPEANRIDLVATHLRQLKNGAAISKPVYDSVAGTAEQVEEIVPRRFIILDGEISTYRQFRHVVDFAVFVDSDWKTQLQTRISRDIEVRGYTRDKAIATFLQSNLREFAEFGAESKSWADLHLYCDSDYSLRIESIADTLRADLETVADQALAPLDLSGLIVPVTTPFAADGSIDRRAFIEHLEWLAHHEAHRVLVNGTTGEFFSLTADERRHVLTLARQYFPGAVLFQAGSDSLGQAVQETRWGDRYGADAILAVPPYYFADAPTEGIVEFFQSLAANVQAPFILHNFPRHTQNAIMPDMLSRIPHFGVKDSGGNAALAAATEHYYVADDARIMEGYENGAFGFFSGLANFAPECYAGFELALRDKDWGAARRIQTEITAATPRFAGHRQIGRIKHAISMRLPSYPTAVRTPLQPAKIDRDTVKRVVTAPFG